MIFIQIASYRDPQLVSTIRDCIAMASNPDNLRFCIAYQYDDSEDLSEFENLPNFTILKIPFNESKGACWARNLIQQEYSGEEYTLQLDSHHRFVQDWDTISIDMIKQLQGMGYAKPLLTTYLPSYNPLNDPSDRVQKPWKMNFDRFAPSGVVLFMPSSIDKWEELDSPIPARFFSAHFAFTLGQHCIEVPHDPNYYFHGEEISIAARSFTHGYDLFHPHKVIAWHEYTRKGRTKHWDDDKEWHIKNTSCHLRNKKLFGMDGEVCDIDFGKHGFGDIRTLHDYELYSGLNFAKRSVQQYTLDNKLAPNPTVEDLDGSYVKQFKHCVNVQRKDVTESDYIFWAVIFKDKDGNDIYRKDADANEIATILDSKVDANICHVWRTFNYTSMPTKWVLWPHSKSKGWCKKIENNI